MHYDKCRMCGTNMYTKETVCWPSSLFSKVQQLEVLALKVLLSATGLCLPAVMVHHVVDISVEGMHPIWEVPDFCPAVILLSVFL